jgi:DNA-binding beta-propeller fold protein YncE
VALQRRPAARSRSNSGASDGQADTVSDIDLEAQPSRVIDKVVVGDRPEGLAISPKGDVAVAVILRGSNANKKAFFYNIDGEKVTKVEAPAATP